MRITQNEILEGLDPSEVYLLVLNGHANGFPYHYWEEGNLSINRANICIRYLIENILNWSNEDVYERFNYYTFHEYSLKNMLKICFNDKYFDAIESAYPNTYKPWLFKTAPRNFWTKDTFREALRWTIEDKLHLTKKQIPQIVCEAFMKEHSLLTGFQKLYNSSTYEAVDDLYPGVYQCFEFKKAPNKYWSKETAIDAVIWHCNKYHNATIEHIINNSTYSFAKKHKLESPLNKLFKGSVPQLIESAYPGIYSIKNKNLKLKQVYFDTF